MRRLSHDTIASMFHAVSTALVTNLLLLVSCLPAVVLLTTTDPVRSWPLLAVSVSLAAPGVAAAFRVFRDAARHRRGTVGTFLLGLRETWRRALLLGVVGTGIGTALLVDVRVLAPTGFAVVAVPLLLVLLTLTAAVMTLALVLIAEAPTARLGTVLRASLLLAVRRWYLTLVSLGVLAVQAVLFTSLPAIAIGVTASAALYLVWANSRFSLAPVLGPRVPDGVGVSA